ncbi:hypothetical protein [Desulforegula conservatrix]|uniref:hypothetical protein n=1 Tax=Desulforegula conservatrix TaxID=153026 RepID=UPI0003FC7E33|nr:hypothetical protein [Desulforegula conservatrix]
MKIFKIMICSCLFMLVVSAIGCSKKEVYEGIYEGMNRSQDREMKDSPAKKQTEPQQPMSFDRYQQERKLLIEKE